MKGGQPQQRQPVPDPANLSQDELASNQEVRCVPWHSGQQLWSVSWVSGIYNQFTKKIPTAGKKGK